MSARTVPRSELPNLQLIIFEKFNFLHKFNMLSFILRGSLPNKSVVLTVATEKLIRGWRFLLRIGNCEH